MACQIFRDNNNRITKVLAANGEPSILWDSLEVLPFLSEDNKVDIYTLAQDVKNAVTDSNGEPLLVVEMNDAPSTLLANGVAVSTDFYETIGRNSNTEYRAGFITGNLKNLPIAEGTRSEQVVNYSDQINTKDNFELDVEGEQIFSINNPADFKPMFTINPKGNPNTLEGFFVTNIKKGKIKPTPKISESVPNVEEIEETVTITEIDVEPNKRTIVAIVGENKRLGSINLIPQGEHYTVDTSNLPEEYRGKGIGISMYLEAIETMDRPVISDLHRTEDAEKVWLRLYDDGYAEKMADGRYISKSKPTINETQNILDGKAIFKRFSQEEHRGFIEGGKHHVKATLLTQRLREASPKDSTEWEAQAEKSLENYAKEQGIWVSDLKKKYGEPSATGAEAYVWFNPNTKKVTKSIGTSVQNGLDNLLDKITIHNNLFPATKLEVIGFAKDSRGDFQVLVEQPFIKGEPTTEPAVIEYMRNLGFRESDDYALEDITFSNDNYVLQDLHLGNVLKTPDGNLAVIDGLFYLNTPDMGYQGKKIVDNTVVYKGKDINFLIVGEQGSKNDIPLLNSLNKAKELEKQGVDYKEIEAKTGWYKVKGDWKTIPKEIVDNFKIVKKTTNKTQTLKEVIGEDNKLFKLYPQIEDVKVTFVDFSKGEPTTIPKDFDKSDYGTFFESENHIVIQEIPEEGEIGTTFLSAYLAHETTHLIQDIENHPKGGDFSTILKETVRLLDIDGDFTEAEDLQKAINEKTKGRDLTNEEFRFVNASLRILSSLDTISEEDVLFSYYNLLFGEVDANIVEQIVSGEIEQKPYSELIEQFSKSLGMTYNTLYDIRFSAQSSQSVIQDKNRALLITEALKAKGFPLNILSERDMIEEVKRRGYENLEQTPDTLKVKESIYGFYDNTTGQIYLTEELLNTNTLTHELYHQFHPILKKQALQGNENAKALLNRFQSIADRLLGGKEKVKEIYENAKRQKDTATEFQIIGEKGAQKVEKYRDNLLEAKRLSNQGVSEIEIENQTGWYFYQGQWRMLSEDIVKDFKIKDNTKEKELTLKEVLGNDNILFTTYPEISDTKVIFLDNNSEGFQTPPTFQKSSGMYDSKSNTILINTTNRDTSKQQYTLAHEVTHRIQDIEGFPKGGNPNSVLQEAMRLLGIKDTNLQIIYFKIQNADKTNFTENQKKILDASLDTLQAVYKQDVKFLTSQYRHLMGEIDATIVETTQELFERGQPVMPYSVMLNFYADQKGVNLDNVFLLGDGNVEFQTSANIFDSQVYAPRVNESFEQYYDRMSEETIARLLGDNSEEYFDKLAKEAGLNEEQTKTFIQQVKDFILDFAKWLKEQLGITDVTAEEIANMPVQELFEKVYVSMTRGDFMENLDFSSEDNFNRWKGGNTLVQGSEVQNVKTGQPIVARVYHGTTNEFYEFDSSVKGNIEGHLGKVNYFTTDYQDASSNYQADGADITNRIELVAERIADQLYDEYSDYDNDNKLDFERVSEDFGVHIEEIQNEEDFLEIGRIIGRRRIAGETEKVLDLYVKLNNPVVLGNNNTWVDLTDRAQFEDYLEDAAIEIAEENDITVEEAKEDYQWEIDNRAMDLSGYENPLFFALKKAISDNTYDYDRASEKASTILSDFYDSELNINQLEKKIREELSGEQNEEGELTSSQIVADLFKNLGYDGIILIDVSQRFRNMGLGESTSHVHVFDEFNNQIKLADGSNVTFGETSDIRFQVQKDFSLGKKEVSALKEGTTVTQNPIQLIKGTFGKRNIDGSIRTAHPNVQGIFSSIDEKVAERYADYKGANMVRFEIPQGTTIEVVNEQVGNKGLTQLRNDETDAINESQAQIVKLITVDSRGQEEQYIIKDLTLLPNANKALLSLDTPEMLIEKLIEKGEITQNCKI